MGKILRGSLAVILTATSLYGLQHAINLKLNTDNLEIGKRDKVGIEARVQVPAKTHPYLSSERATKYGLTTASIIGLLTGINGLIGLRYKEERDSEKREPQDSLG